MRPLGKGLTSGWVERCIARRCCVSEACVSGVRCRWAVTAEHLKTHGPRIRESLLDGLCHCATCRFRSRVVVDVDLEKFFGQVNHDIVTERLVRRIDETAVLRLIRAGFMDDGVVTERFAGTPQGCPLSPLLAHVLRKVYEVKSVVGAASN